MFIPITIFIIIATFDTRLTGLFIQKRVGRNKKEFWMLKIRTLNSVQKASSIGLFMRKYKLDELPQLINILKGDMSLVGIRPELPEYYEQNQDFPVELLKLKPGLTGLASLYFYNEDELRKRHRGAKFENWMQQRKNTLNSIYARHYSVCYDMKIMYFTLNKILSL